jgi:DNA polymerase-3 subunit epsilon
MKKKPFPFEIICTHKLTRRLLPNLPRKGLRAAAGYLGYSVPELRRANHHTAATVFIWHRVVQLLEEQGIHTLEEMNQWLKTPLSGSNAGCRDFPMEPDLRRKLPKEPGIYRMLRSNGDLLYIGKATSLKHRVNSYFHKKKQGAQARNTLEMLTQASHLEVVVTGSALEAALLENDEIKKHSPPYNVALRQRDREIAFFSRDLRQYAAEVDDSHPIGPLPSKESLAAFAAIATLLDGQLLVSEDMDISSLSLGVPSEYAPETGCFREGVEIFRDRHGSLLKINEGGSIIKNLLMLGKQLRRQKLEELAAAASEEDNNEVPEEGEEQTETWTPESVADVMEGVIRYGAHLLRRSRWFCLLSESSLAWQTGETAGRHRRLLILQEGNVIRQEDMAMDQPIPSPPGHGKTFDERRQNFDVMTYDRLRVLTTELRRIAADETDRHVQLRLSPKAVLGRQQLLHLLQWV